MAHDTVALAYTATQELEQGNWDSAFLILCHSLTRLQELNTPGNRSDGNDIRVEAKEFTFDCPHDYQSFPFFTKAFVPILPNDNADENGAQVPCEWLAAVTLYDTAVAMHIKTMLNASDTEWHKVVAMYQKSFESIELLVPVLCQDANVPTWPEFLKQYSSIALLGLAVLNNMGHVFHILHNDEGATCCVDAMGEILAAIAESGGNEQDGENAAITDLSYFTRVVSTYAENTTAGDASSEA